MEETKILHVLTFFISSNQIEELHLQLFDTNDQFLTEFTIKNYNSHQVKLHKDTTEFYCITTCPQHKIQVQFQCDFSENERQYDKMSILRSESAFKLKIQSEIIKEYHIITADNSPQNQQAELYRIASKNIKHLQKKIFLKMELQLLARPIYKSMKKSKVKFNVSHKKSKTNLFNALNKPIIDMCKIEESSERGDSFHSKLRASERSMMSLDDKKYATAPSNFKRFNKHKTFTMKPRRSSQISSFPDQDQLVLENQSELPEYVKLFRQVNKSVQRMNSKVVKTKKYSSVLKKIQSQAEIELQRKKQFLTTVQSVAEHLKATRTERPSVTRQDPVQKKKKLPSKMKGIYIYKKRKIL